MRKPGVSFNFAFVVTVVLFGAGAGCGGTPVQVPACDPPCAAGTVCVEGNCVVADGGAPSVDLSVLDAAGCPMPCREPTPYCGPNHACVPCLMDSHCPTGKRCRLSDLGNTCVDGCTDDTRCGGGTMKCCDGLCIDTAKDTGNCGACGNQCSAPNGSVKCVASQCVLGCAAGWGDCNGDPSDGCETNLRVDTRNCAGCGKACNIPNAVAACSDGCYIAACNFGYDDCDGEPQTGCETSVSNDLNNCGGCGQFCKAGPRARVVCDAGTCRVTGCDPGFSDCDGDAKNGCEIVTASDVKNCGKCGNACPPNTVCVAGECTCPPCKFPNAEAACQGLVCVLQSCSTNYGDCDGDVKNGCERPLAGDVNNCGACNKVCPNGLVCVMGGCTCPQCNFPNAKSICVNNQCQLDQCLPGFANCDNAAANGCETDTRADAKNCGGCGTTCPQDAPFCTGGKCNNILASCLAYSKGGGQNSGVFTIDPDGNGPIQPLKVYCDMTMDGGGWTLAMTRKVDDSNPGGYGKSLTWNCLSSTAPPASPTDVADTVLPYGIFAAMNPSDMMLMAGSRIIKFAYARQGGVPFVNNYRYLTERTCYEAMGIGDAPCTGGTRSGCGHTNDACTTTDYALWKLHDNTCPHDATNSHLDVAYCAGSNCGSWGNCPGGGNSPPMPTPNCWFYGGSNACSIPSISNCPQQSRAPWADYTTGTLSGYYNLWIR